MTIIKRYPNRKLYDTESKKYISLDGIAALIQDDKEVRVIDHITGEDLTALTLTQIIMEYEKRRDGFLPLFFLIDLIRSSRDKIGIISQSRPIPPIFMHLLDNEIRRRIQELVRAGELNEYDARNLSKKLLSFPPRLPQQIILEECVETYITIRQIPCKEDLRTLNQRLENLDNRLADLSTKRG